MNNNMGNMKYYMYRRYYLGFYCYAYYYDKEKDQAFTEHRNSGIVC